MLGISHPFFFKRIILLLVLGLFFLDLTKAAESLLPIKTEKPKVIVFLSAKCPCSEAHEDSLRELAKTYAQGFEWIGVHSNANESGADSKLHFTQARLPFTVEEDPDQKLANQYGALKTPHVFIVKNGETLYSGGVDDTKGKGTVKIPYLKTALLQTLKGEKPNPSLTRTLGCTIERK